MDLTKRIGTLMIYLAAGAAIGTTAQLLAEPDATKPVTPAVPTAPQSARDNIARLQKSITVDFNESKLEDVMKFMSDNTGAQFEPIWKVGSEDGLDKEMLITLSVKGLDALTVLEKIMDKASGDALNSDEKVNWQVTPYGAVQVGLRKTLNRHRRVEVYDVSDLLFEVPVYDEVPEINLDQVLQSGGGRGGGGGGQSPFGGGGGGRGGNQQRQTERRQRRQELADELKRLVTSLAEKDQWEDNGGTGGTITVYQGNIIVDAPDYMHRALVGYSWWPTNKQSASKGRRYVSVSQNLGISQLIGMQPFTETGATR